MDTLVSVICLCHNHSRFIAAAVDSVLNQSHEHIELIIVDDGSSDGSKEVITSLIADKPEIQYIDLSDSIGNCAAFNGGWRQSKGNYLIDLAADDVLLPDRIRIGLDKLSETNAGVHYTDVLLIDENNEPLGRHSDRIQGEFVEGDVFADLVERFVVSAPGMMFRREVMDYLNGYDETLAYEDFDFWVRSSRMFKYCFSKEAYVHKRVLSGSLAKRQNQWRNTHQRSTLRVCQKAARLVKSTKERAALRRRCWTEIKQCIKKGNPGLIPGYLSVLKNSAN